VRWPNPTLFTPIKVKRVKCVKWDIMKALWLRHASAHQPSRAFEDMCNDKPCGTTWYKLMGHAALSITPPVRLIARRATPPQSSYVTAAILEFILFLGYGSPHCSLVAYCVHRQISNCQSFRTKFMLFG